MIKRLITKYRNWSAQNSREYQRSKPIELVVRIPYTPGNELVTRGLRVMDLNVMLNVPLERVEVRCIGNPDWRK